LTFLSQKYNRVRNKRRKYADVLEDRGPFLVFLAHPSVCDQGPITTVGKLEAGDARQNGVKLGAYDVLGQHAASPRWESLRQGMRAKTVSSWVRMTFSGNTQRHHETLGNADSCNRSLGAAPSAATGAAPSAEPSAATSLMRRFLSARTCGIISGCARAGEHTLWCFGVHNKRSQRTHPSVYTSGGFCADHCFQTKQMKCDPTVFLHTPPPLQKIVTALWQNPNSDLPKKNEEKNLDREFFLRF